MTFTDPLVDGNGGLVIPRIKSPNFAAGAAGWDIAQDGSAEFNNATFRGTVIIDSATKSILVYSGVPGPGTLLLALAPVAGVDQFGNNFAKGLSLEGDNVGGFLQFMRNDGTIQGTIYDNGPGNGIVLNTPGGQSLILNSTGLIWLLSTAGVQIGNGPSGKYYATDRTYAQAGIVTATFTTVSPLNTVIAENLDYTSHISAGGVFTPPIAGYYDITHHTSVPAGTAYCNIRKNGTMIVEAAGAAAPPSAAQSATCGITGLWLDPAGDTIDFRVWQNSGANQTMTGHITIARRI